MSFPRRQMMIWTKYLITLQNSSVLIRQLNILLDLNRYSKTSARIPNREVYEMKYENI